jgi:hypothetical protein
MISRDSLLLLTGGEAGGIGLPRCIEPSPASTTRGDDHMDEYALQCALTELEALNLKGGFIAKDVIPLLSIMNVREVVEYLDAKTSNQFQ